MQSLSLFAQEPEEKIVVPSPEIIVPDFVGNFQLRDYQQEDADAVEAAWNNGKKAVVVRHATGLGKSVLLSELAGRMMRHGRVLVVVDVGSLARDLYKTILKHTGRTPGSLTGTFKSHHHNAQVVVATIQTLYAGKNSNEWYRYINPMEFSCLLIDETEGALADKYTEVINHFRNGNPNIKIAGASATPFRTDKKAMAELFDHAEQEPGPLNRDILWAVMNGWLVKPRQGFVHCALDFATLKVRKGKDGEKDYTDDQLEKLMLDQDEQQWRQMAKGIHEAAKGNQAIIMCPNSVKVAQQVAFHLCGEAQNDGIAHPVYGAQGDKADDLMAAFKRGEFQYIVSVKKLEKGFDYDKVRYAFMLRKTRSRRMYEQFVGRTVRPLVEIRDALNAEPSPEIRRKIIEDSAKPWSIVFDLVGVHPDAKDLGVIDILGTKLSEEVREHAKGNMLKSLGDPDKKKDEYDVGQEARNAFQEIKSEKELERERKMRSAIQVGGHVSIEYGDELGRAYPTSRPAKRVKGRGDSTPKQVKLLIAMGVQPETALSYNKRQAGKVIHEYKEKGTNPVWRRLNDWERMGNRVE